MTAREKGLRGSNKYIPDLTVLLRVVEQITRQTEASAVFDLAWLRWPRSDHILKLDPEVLLVDFVEQ